MKIFLSECSALLKTRVKVHEIQEVLLCISVYHSFLLNCNPVSNPTNLQMYL